MAGWIAAVAISTALALLYGRLIAPRLATSDPIVRAVATLGFALIILGFCEFIWGEWPRRSACHPTTWASSLPACASPQRARSPLRWARPSPLE